MSQIPLHSSGAAASSALSGIGGPSAGTRKDSGRALSTPASATTSFSQLLNQSAQHLQTKAPQAQAFTAPTPSASQTPSTPSGSAKSPSANRPANANGNGNGGSANGTSSTAQDENKLSARNALNRNAANKQADAPKTPAHPTQARTDASDRAAQAQDASAKGKKADAATQGDAADPADAANEATAKDDTGAADKAGATDPTAAAQQMLAMLRGDAPAEARPQARDGALTDGAADGQTAVAGHGKGHHAAGGAADHDALQQELQQAAQSAVDGKPGAEEGLEGMQALAGGAKEIALGDQAAGGPGHSFEALLAAAQQADATSAATGTDATSRSAEVPTVPLSQPLDSPDFAPELSASVSLLMKDGVHEAQLQLNPTDMGPVAIQIQLDGQQAQVNFHAEQAATRDVLMRSMPDLAAALQSQGITLSGGGVFAQTQSGGGHDGRGSDGEGNGRRSGRGGGSGDDGLTSVARTERRTQPRGLVDLYA